MPIGRIRTFPTGANPAARCPDGGALDPCVLNSCSQLAHDRTTPVGTGRHQTTPDDT
jgi:hypothetical protein